MSNEDTKKFTFHCGVIDKLFKQIDGMSNKNRFHLENMFDKVSLSLKELNKYEEFFSDPDDCFAYIEKASQVQSKIESFIERQVAKSEAASVPEKVGGISAKQASVPAAKASAPQRDSFMDNTASAKAQAIDYGKIPDSEYRMLIDGKDKPGKTFSKLATADSEPVEKKNKKIQFQVSPSVNGAGNSHDHSTESQFRESASGGKMSQHFDQNKGFANSSNGKPTRSFYHSPAPPVAPVSNWPENCPRCHFDLKPYYPNYNQPPSQNWSPGRGNYSNRGRGKFNYAHTSGNFNRGPTFGPVPNSSNNMKGTSKSPHNQQ